MPTVCRSGVSVFPLRLGRVWGCVLASVVPNILHIKKLEVEEFPSRLGT